MPLHCLCCGSNAAVLIAALALLVVPPSIFLPLLPDAFLSSQTLKHVDDLDKLVVVSPKNTFADYFYEQSVDLLPSIIVLTIGLILYLYEWIHRKLMERRIIMMRAFLGESIERLRETDGRRQQLESTLRLARGAAAEYNLLLYLLLRKRKEVPEWGQEEVI